MSTTSDPVEQFVEASEEARLLRIRGIGKAIVASRDMKKAEDVVAEQARQLAEAQAIVARASMPGFTSAPTVTSQPAPAAPAVPTAAAPTEPAMQTPPPRGSKVSRPKLYSVVAAVAAFFVVLVVWNMIAPHAGGSANFASSGWVGFLLGVLAAVAAWFLTYGSLKRKEEARAATPVAPTATLAAVQAPTVVQPQAAA